MANFSTVLGGSKIALEQVAVSQFGAAVENFTRNKLQSVTGVNLTDPKVDRTAGWYSTSYAAHLANSSMRPKLAFMFKVDFVFSQNPAVQTLLKSVMGTEDQRSFSFLVKSVDRPKYDFDYKEVNQYNFRTKVLQSIKHSDLSMVILDDVGNRLFKFFRFIMAAHSPIMRQGINLDGSQNPSSSNVGSGMSFSGISDVVGAMKDFAHRGTINTAYGNIIDHILIRQIYVNPMGNLDVAVHEDIYDFVNCRLIRFDLSELSYETNDATALIMQFDYDWLAAYEGGTSPGPGQSGILYQTPGTGYNNVGQGIHGAPLDISPTGRATGGGNSSGLGKPYLNILTQGAGRAAQVLTGDALNKITGKLPGGLGQQINNAVGGMIGNIATEQASGLISNIQQSFARPSGGAVVDSGTGTSTGSIFPSSSLFKW